MNTFRFFVHLSAFSTILHNEEFGHKIGPASQRESITAAHIGAVNEGMPGYNPQVEQYSEIKSVNVGLQEFGDFSPKPNSYPDSSLNKERTFRKEKPFDDEDHYVIHRYIANPTSTIDQIETWKGNQFMKICFAENQEELFKKFSKLPYSLTSLDENAVYIHRFEINRSGKKTNKEDFLKLLIEEIPPLVEIRNDIYNDLNLIGSPALTGKQFTEKEILQAFLRDNNINNKWPIFGRKEVIPISERLAFAEHYESYYEAFGDPKKPIPVPEESIDFSC